MDDGMAVGGVQIDLGKASSPLKPAATRPARARRYGLAGIVVVLLVAAGGAVWWNAGRPAAVHYTATPVTRGPVARSVTATGTINPVLTVIVGSYVSGVIQELSCDYNTQVTKGQICARIDPRPYQTVVDQDKAILAVARAQLEKDKANLEYAKVNSGRMALLAQQKSIALDVADQTKSVYHQAQAQIMVDEAAIQQREAELATAQVNLGYTNIISPVDGTVVSRNVTVGQTVAASFQTPTLFLIASDLTKMEVDTNVSESDIGGIKENNPASFTVEAYPDRLFEGSVVQVRHAPQTIQNVVTFNVVVGVANPDLLLVPGMTARTKIVTDKRDDVMRVPDQALRYVPADAATAAPQPAPGGAARQGQVWVLADGKPVRVAVTLGLDDDSFTEIVGGELKPGDRVILSEQSGGAGKGARPTVAPPRL
jgi:HlyD family secretion protein